MNKLNEHYIPMNSTIYYSHILLHPCFLCTCYAKRPNAGFGVGPFSLPTSTEHVHGLRKGMSGLKGVGLGQLTKRVRLKPSHRIKAHVVVLGSSSKQVSEDSLGAFFASVEPPAPEQGLVEALSLTASTTVEGCLGATIGDGSSSGVVPIPPASSLVVTVAAFPLGKEREGCLGASEDECPAKDWSSLGADLSKDSKPTIPVSAQTTSVVPYSLGRDREDFVPVLAKVGFLRWGFFGLRITSLASSSLDCKDVPVKDKGTSVPVNGMIRRGFFGSSPASPKIPVMT